MEIFTIAVHHLPADAETCKQQLGHSWAMNILYLVNFHTQARGARPGLAQSTCLDGLVTPSASCSSHFHSKPALGGSPPENVSPSTVARQDTHRSGRCRQHPTPNANCTKRQGDSWMLQTTPKQKSAVYVILSYFSAAHVRNH